MRVLWFLDSTGDEEPVHFLAPADMNLDEAFREFIRTHNVTSLHDTRWNFLDWLCSDRGCERVLVPNYHLVSATEGMCALDGFRASPSEVLNRVVTGMLKGGRRVMAE